MVADPTRRAILYDLDTAITTVRHDLGDEHPSAISLTGHYHNLMRMWAEV